MKKIYTFLTLLSFSAALLATEARVESMGSGSDFIKDDISVFNNPATAFGFGNLLVGSLGKMTQTSSRWTRSEQWFGGWAVYPLDSSLKIGAGATVNRPFKSIQLYHVFDQNDLFTVNNGGNRFRQDNYNPSRNIDYLEILDMRDPIGNIYGFAGVSWKNEITAAIGARYAGNSLDVGAENNSSLSVKGGNLGLTYRLDNLMLEASFNYDLFSLEVSRKLRYNDTATGPPVVVTPESTQIHFSSNEGTADVMLRGLYTLSSKNTLVPLLSLNKGNMLGVNNRDLGVGMGFNRDLFKGFLWAGVKYVYHSAEYPTTIGGERIYPANDTGNAYPPGVTESSHKLVYSFGVEKKMLWDWFTLRVGGNKVFEYLTKKNKSPEYTVEEGIYERDVDAVGWGIAIGTPDDRLKFDVTFSEAFPYSNILAGGEGGLPFGFAGGGRGAGLFFPGLGFRV